MNDTGDSNETVLDRISSDSVREATGRDWQQWLEALDDAGAADWQHKEIVAYLERAHSEATSAWWRQSIAVAYEQARGKRVVGQTADVGFQVGVQRTLQTSPTEAWELITGRTDLWLGEGADVEFAEGAQYRVPPAGGASGASGEIRVVRPGERLRMTWQPDDWPEPATLQLRLSWSPSGRTSIHVHLENLPDAGARQAMRTRWRAALDRISDAAR